MDETDEAIEERQKDRETERERLPKSQVAASEKRERTGDVSYK